MRRFYSKQSLEYIRIILTLSQYLKSIIINLRLKYSKLIKKKTILVLL